MPELYQMTVQSSNRSPPNAGNGSLGLRDWTPKSTVGAPGDFAETKLNSQIEGRKSPQKTLE
jgi:hypothetical protein